MLSRTDPKNPLCLSRDRHSHTSRCWPPSSNAVPFWAGVGPRTAEVFYLRVSEGTRRDSNGHRMSFLRTTGPRSLASAKLSTHHVRCLECWGTCIFRQIKSLDTTGSGKTTKTLRFLSLAGYQRVFAHHNLRAIAFPPSCYDDTDVH